MSKQSLLQDDVCVVTYMRQALMQARKAAQQHEVPIGSIVVDKQGIIIARAYNKVESKKTQMAHAEVLALAKACKRLQDWRLDGCWVYVTVEPCTMCMGLILLSRCAGVVYGATSPLFGCGLDSMDLPVYRKGSVRVVSGVLAEDAAVLMKQFFRNKRAMMDNITVQKG